MSASVPGYTSTEAGASCQPSFTSWILSVLTSNRLGTFCIKSGHAGQAMVSWVRLGKVLWVLSSKGHRCILLNSAIKICSSPKARHNIALLLTKFACGGMYPTRGPDFQMEVALMWFITVKGCH